ncbi:hypothetical protein BSZ36_18240 [Rubricoccus marinus]|uniref:AAA+ ATPase domain-containing protein n=2 Tax=Rubricoccus marinus TaxID=716817 RepID=A0A259TUA1_9BACT|nr:hypothetical protein BSZ36_18240 [Rubricoccus marinus]
MLEGLLLGVAGSVTADWLSKGGAWVLSRSPVSKAIGDTVRRYDSIEGRRVREALERWVKGGAFVALLAALKSGERDGIEGRFVDSFREKGGYHEIDPEHVRATQVVRQFVQHLRARLLEAGRLDLLDVHVAEVGRRLEAGQARLSEGQQEILDNQEILLGKQNEMLHRLGDGPSALTDDDLDEAERRLRAASESLLTWPTTTRGVWLDRPELEHLLVRVATEDTSVTLIEGDRGTGKSALLSVFAQRLGASDVTVGAVKADRLPLGLVDADDVIPDVPGGCVRGIRELAARQPVVVVLDQLDALSDVSDVHPGRLNAVLDLIDRLRGAPGVSVVASVRPFERSVDTRLQSSFREVVGLESPSWEAIEPLLTEGGHDTSSMSVALRELLRVPEFLRVYLRVAAPDKAYASWHRLYDDYWQTSVLPAHTDAAELVRVLVERMSEEEALWVPSSLVDAHAKAYDALLRADVLARDGDRVGFRHQALFEFARSRRFTDGTGSLVEYVRKREDGLFVRPVLLAGLTALRSGSPRRYRDALAAFLGGSFRAHIEQLVGEYVAAQEEPTAEELAALLPRLDGPRARQTFAAMRQSAGWFRVLVASGTLAREMRRPPDEALAVLGILGAASKRGDGQAVFDLVRAHWLGAPAYDEYALSALDEMPSWAPEVTRAMMEVAYRFPRAFRHHIVMIGLKGDAAAGFEALRAELDRETEEAFAASEASGNATRAAEPKGELAASAYREQARRSVVREWHQWPEIAGRVGDAPDVFAKTVWAWFEGALLDEPASRDRAFMYRSPLIDSGWDDDETERDRTLLGVATRFLTALGEADEGAYAAAVERLSNDDRMRSHRAVARSFAALAGRYTEPAVAYLLGDPRRLLLSTIRSEVGETVALLRALSPHLTTGQRDALEAQLRAFAPPRPDDEDETRWADVTDRARLRLMRGMEDPSDAFGEERQAAEETYPDLPDEAVRMTGFAAVRPPVPSPRLAELGAEEWTETMDRVLGGEAAALAEAHHEDDVPPPHLGGVEQQASAFGEAATAAPGEAWEVLDQLADVRYEPFVTELIGGIASSKEEAAVALRPLLPERVARFDAAGFASPSFRYRSSDALARVRGGLDVETLARLESWFWEADVSTVEVSDPTGDRVQPLLFGNAPLILGGGKGHMLEAMAAGCFYRPEPAFPWWTAFIGRLAEAEPHERTAATAIRLSGDLFHRSNPDHARATEALAALVRACPEAVTRPEGLIGLSQVLRHLDPPEAALDLADLVRGLAWDGAEQAYGEMMIALHVGTHRDASAARIREGTQQGDDTLLGMAFGAAALWVQAKSERPLLLEVLEAATASDDEHAAGAAHRAVQSFALGSPPRAWVPEDEALIRAILASDPALRTAFEGVLAAAADRIRLAPDLAHEAATAVVSGVERGVFDRWQRARLAEPLLQIALTLHRFPGHREHGLALFESVYTLGLGAARAAIQTLDRNPFRS